MKKKIISMGVVSMFLLTGLFVFSVSGTEIDKDRIDEDGPRKGGLDDCWDWKYAEDVAIEFGMTTATIMQIFKLPGTLLQRIRAATSIGLIAAFLMFFPLAEAFDILNWDGDQY
jgi:hypothetical protein